MNTNIKHSLSCDTLKCLIIVHCLVFIVQLKLKLFYSAAFSTDQMFSSPAFGKCSAFFATVLLVTFWPHILEVSIAFLSKYLLYSGHTFLRCPLHCLAKYFFTIFNLATASSREFIILTSLDRQLIN